MLKTENPRKILYSDQRSINLAYGLLQNPVSAQRRVTRSIRRRGHIRPSCDRNLSNKRLPLIALRHIAAIQQQIARAA